MDALEWTFFLIKYIRYLTMDALEWKIQSING